MPKRLIYAEDALANIDRDRAYMSDVGRIHARAAVNEAPTVGEKPVVHGRWFQEIGDLHSSGVLYYCSVCNKHHFVKARHSLPTLSYFGELFEKPNYCPNCGADMRGEEDG